MAREVRPDEGYRRLVAVVNLVYAACHRLVAVVNLVYVACYRLVAVVNLVYAVCGGSGEYCFAF